MVKEEWDDDKCNLINQRFFNSPDWLDLLTTHTVPKKQNRFSRVGWTFIDQPVEVTISAIYIYSSTNFSIK